MLKASLKSHWPPQVGRRPELGKEHARTLAGAGFIAPFTQSAHLDQFLVHAKAGRCRLQTQLLWYKRASTATVAKGEWRNVAKYRPHEP